MTRLIGLYSHAPGSGKSTVANMTWDFKKISFASPTREFCAKLVSALGHDGLSLFQDTDKKEKRIAEIGVSPRQMMQTLGTEWGRSCIHPELWVMVAAGAVEQQRKLGRDVVIDDVRFPNEAEMIRRLGGELWLVDRPNVVYDGDHASEGALADVVPDAVINNGGSLKQLREVVAALLE
ncbi:MAG: adenylate kinase [Alphaproteobacteria bacterium]